MQVPGHSVSLMYKVEPVTSALANRILPGGARRPSTFQFIAASRSDYGRDDLLPAVGCGFSPRHSTADMVFVTRRLQELVREEDIALYMCFIGLTRSLLMALSTVPSCRCPRSLWWVDHRFLSMVCVGLFLSMITFYKMSWGGSATVTPTKWAFA